MIMNKNAHLIRSDNTDQKVSCDWLFAHFLSDIVVGTFSAPYLFRFVCPNSNF